LIEVTKPNSLRSKLEADPLNDDLVYFFLGISLEDELKQPMEEYFQGLMSQHPIIDSSFHEGIYQQTVSECFKDQTDDLIKLT